MSKPLSTCDQCRNFFIRSDNIKRHERTCTAHNCGKYTIDMKEARNLSTLKKAINAMKPTMLKFQREHDAFNFQVAVDIVFHNRNSSRLCKYREPGIPESGRG